jgi:hypothetical protein
VEEDLLAAMGQRMAGVVYSMQYRCYKLWKFDSFTLILAGIGTGTLEPVLWETLTTGVVRRIVLIGTAGLVRDGAPCMGRAMPVGEAYSCGTGVDADAGEAPLRPRWPGLEGMRTCSIASSDFFYGYSDRVLDGTFRACQGAFRERYMRIKPLADLIDMEVAGFYYLAPHFAPEGRLDYLAIKGSSNALGKGEEMNGFAQSVMDDCVEQAFALLGA